MKVLVTGAAGQLGSELARLARPGAVAMIALSRDRLDITNADKVGAAFAAHGPAVAINCAAYTMVDRAEVEPERAFAVNAAGAGNLARACRDAGIPLLHLSTDYVFDGAKDDAYTEADSVAPLSIYGRSKWEGEEAIRHQLENHIILRSSWFFSVHGHNFVKKMLRLGRERTEVEVVADRHGCPTPASAIAEALVAVARRAARGAGVDWGTYHFCGRPPTTWHAFARAVFEVACDLGLLDHAVAVRPIGSSHYPRPAKTPAKAVLDCTKWSRAFDIATPSWRPALEAVLRDMARRKGNAV